MRRLANGTQVPALPAPAAAVGAPGYGSNGNPALGQQGSIFDAGAYNVIQEELMAFLTTTGIAPDNTGVGLNQVLAACNLLYGTELFVFANSGTLVVPPGKDRALVLVWAAGGGGGGTGGANSAGSGAGAGEFRMGMVAGLAGQSVPITVGTAGPAGTNGGAPTNGGAGVNSSFGTAITAIGGGPGLAALNGLQTTGAGIGGMGGSGGQLVIGGTSGGMAIGYSGTVNEGGTGGSTFMSSIPAPNVNQPGQPGVFPGGGGNGGAAGGIGGIGAKGLVLVLFT